MNSNKISTLKEYFTSINNQLEKKDLEKIDYRIIVISDSYFFYVDQQSMNRYFEQKHTDIKGWYTGLLAFKNDESNFFHLFLSKLLLDKLDTQNLLFRILYQLFMYLNEDLRKLKYKKLRKRIMQYYLTVLPDTIAFDSSDVYKILRNTEDSILYTKAATIIPHISLSTLIERMPSTTTTLYIDDITNYLNQSEIMIPHLTKQYHTEHHHNHHH